MTIREEGDSRLNLAYKIDDLTDKFVLLQSRRMGLRFASIGATLARAIVQAVWFGY